MDSGTGAPQLVAHWRSAAADLGLEIEAPFERTLGSGRRIRAPLLLRNFGGVQGMVILSRSTELEGVEGELEQAGFGYCVMSEPRSDEVYARSVVIEVLNDWGWTGAPAERPTWLVEPESRTSPLGTAIRAGAREQFCIEAVVDSNVEPDWIFGSLHLWIGGARLGHEYGGTVLKGCRNLLEDLARDEVDRRIPEFLDRGAERVLADLRRAVFVDGEPESLLRAWWLCELDVFMDALEDYDLLLLEARDGRDRVVWKRQDSTEVHEILLPQHLVKRVAAEFVERFDEALINRSPEVPPSEL